jgi:ABC-type lipoprotein export system ATPase subunit
MKRKPEHLQITKLHRTYNPKTNTFTYNITYKTTTQTTPRTQKIQQAFGLGTDQQQKFTILDNIQLKIHPTDIIYITGDSGSGKTTLLKALKKDLKNQATDITNPKPPPNKPIINTIGKTFTQALNLLSKVGLNDAFILLRTYNQLSQGQKHRYHLAQLIQTGKQWWITDEFCSTLDRDTAKIVAYNLQKTARQLGKAVIAATTHTDLKKDLNPTIHIHKKYGKQIQITHHKPKPNTQCTLTKQTHIQPGTINDYRQLSPYHYRTTSCPPPRKIFTLKRKNELAGVIVYSHPPPTTPGRTKIWKGTFQQLQKELSTITRVIIHPKYRTTGLGTTLVKQTLPQAGTPHVETLAVMAKYNPFFEKAGMHKITETKPNQHVQQATEQLTKLGFNPLLLNSTQHTTQTIHTTNRNSLTNILAELSKKEPALRRRLLGSGSIYQSHAEFTEKISSLAPQDLAEVLKRLDFLRQTKVYLFWSANSP